MNINKYPNARIPQVVEWGEISFLCGGLLLRRILSSANQFLKCTQRLTCYYNRDSELVEFYNLSGFFLKWHLPAFELTFFNWHCYGQNGCNSVSLLAWMCYYQFTYFARICGIPTTINVYGWDAIAINKFMFLLAMDVCGSAIWMLF